MINIYILIYKECEIKDCFDDNIDFINWRLEKNLQKIYDFINNNRKYEYYDCYKIGKQVKIDKLIKYKNNSGDNDLPF